MQCVGWRRVVDGAEGVTPAIERLVLAAPFLVQKSMKSAGGRRLVEGIMSTADEDYDGERIPEEAARYHYFLHRAAVNKAMLDKFNFEPFQNRHGWLKYEHAGDGAHACKGCGGACFREPDIIVGWPVEVEKSHAYRDPVSGMPKVGTRLVAELFAEHSGHPFADSAWQLLSAIEKSQCPKRIGWSIEAAYPEHPVNGIVGEALVTGVVLTTKPVNTHTWAQVRKSLLGLDADPPTDCHCKALTAGPSGTDSATLTGGAALRVQSHQGLPVKRCRKLGCTEATHDHREIHRSLLTHLVERGHSIEAATQAICRKWAA